VRSDAGDTLVVECVYVMRKCGSRHKGITRGKAILFSHRYVAGSANGRRVLDRSNGGPQKQRLNREELKE